MVEKIAQEIVNFIIAGFSNKLEKKIIEKKKQQEYETFLKLLGEWCEKYILDNETTIISGSYFSAYIKNFNIVEKIIDFITHPTKEEKESFLKACCKNAEEYLSKKQSLTYADKRCLKEFFSGIFEQTYEFYSSKIPDELIVTNYILEQLGTKIDGLSADIGNLTGSLSVAKPICFKKIYPFPSNAIVRKIALYTDIQLGFFLNAKTEDMVNVCVREKHVVLLGEAGCGKTIALKQLAALLCETDFYPLVYDLNNYVNGTIDDIIESEYAGVDREKLFLIFDGYDEIEEKNRNEFARRLQKFSEMNPDVIILISSRNNFYKFSDDNGQGGLFAGFKEYGIAPIIYEDIKQYIKENNIDYEAFFKEVSRNELQSLVFVPFYLVELIRIFRPNNSLPHKSEVMEQIIRNRFDKDCRKYVRTESLEDYEEKIFSCLEKLAFAMQCMRKVKIENREYQRLFEDSESRKLIQYSGIFSKDGNKSWNFEHNNFREYLAAKYINGFDMERIKEITCNNQGKIYNSWVNVLSFLILIREGKDLENFLLSSNSEMIVRFEKNRIPANQREDIVIKIIKNFADKNIWLSQGLNNAELLAQFGESQKLCEFLLEQVVASGGFRAQHNALSVLCEFSNFFGMNKEVKETLFSCLKSDQVRDYEKEKILEIIARKGLDDKEISEYVIKSFDEKLSEDYKCGVLRYLNILKKHEEHMDLFFEIYKRIRHALNNSSGLTYEIAEAFSNTCQGENICEIVKLISKNDRLYVLKNRYDNIISNAIICYQEGETRVFDAVLDSLNTSHIYNHDFFEKSLIFFEKTNTKRDAFFALVDKCLETDIYRLIDIMERIMDDECCLDLLNKYANSPDKYESIIVALFRDFDVGCNLYNEYKKSLLNHGVKLSERRKHFDYTKIRNKSRQYYFDSLFDKDTYCELVRKMVCDVGDENITFSKLGEIEYHPIDYSVDKDQTEESLLQRVYDGIVTNENDNRVVIDTITAISDWKTYAICKGSELLERKPKIEISHEQKEIFRQYCCEQLKEIDFSKEIFDEGNGISYTFRAVRVIFLSVYFDFVYDKETIFKMLMVPPYFFRAEENFVEGRVPQYINGKVTEIELAEQIKCNLSGQQMCSDVADMHITYCKDNNLDWAVPLAKTICSDQNSHSWSKRSAIEYLEKVNGFEYVYDNFLDSSDEKIIESIISVTLKYKNERLRKRLEELCRESLDGRRFLATLITLSSKYGLQRYAEIIKCDMKATDIKDNTMIDTIIEAIGGVNDINLLDEIGHLQKMLFLPGFEDRTHFGLRNAIYKAYQNMERNNEEKMREYIDALLQNPEISDDEKGFCNSLLLDFEYAHNQREDVAWSINKVKEFLKENY